MRKSILLCFIFFVFFAASASATPQDIIDCISRENKRFENCNPSEVGDLYEYKGNCDVSDLPRSKLSGVLVALVDPV